MDSSYSIDEVNEYRNNIMLYIINNSVNKLPLKVSDIVEKVLDKNGKRFKFCFPLAKEALKEVKYKLLKFKDNYTYNFLFAYRIMVLVLLTFQIPKAEKNLSAIPV